MFLPVKKSHSLYLQGIRTPKNVRPFTRVVDFGERQRRDLPGVVGMCLRYLDSYFSGTMNN